MLSKTCFHIVNHFLVELQEEEPQTAHPINSACIQAYTCSASETSVSYQLKYPLKYASAGTAEAHFNGHVKSH